MLLVTMLGGPHEGGHAEVPPAEFQQPSVPPIMMYPHVSHGGAFDQRIFRDDNDRLVKFDALGRLYQVDESGLRITKAARAKHLSREVWRTLTPNFLRKKKDLVFPLPLQSQLPRG